MFAAFDVLFSLSCFMFFSCFCFRRWGKANYEVVCFSPCVFPSLTRSSSTIRSPSSSPTSRQPSRRTLFLAVFGFSRVDNVVGVSVGRGLFYYYFFFVCPCALSLSLSLSFCLFLSLSLYLSVSLCLQCMRRSDPRT